MTGVSDLLVSRTDEEMVKSNVFEAVQLSDGTGLMPTLAITRTLNMIRYVLLSNLRQDFAQRLPGGPGLKLVLKSLLVS